MGFPTSASVAIAIALAATHAHAQNASAQAESLFDQGKALMAKQQFAEACKAFDSSQRIEPAVTTLLNLADCREKAGQLATAYGVFVDVERQTRGNAEQGPLHDVATKRSAALEPRLSKLTIKAVPTDGLAITRDGVPIDRATWSFALPVDGGTYAIVAQAPGRVTWRSEVVVAREGAAVVVDVPALAAVGAPQPRSKLPAIVVGAGAIVLGGVALGFELSARSVYADAEDEADNTKQTSLWESANRRRHVAQAFGIAAVVATGVSAYLFVRSTRVVPVVTPDGAGVAWAGAW